MTHVNQKNALAPAAEANTSRGAGESAIIGLARQMGPLWPLLTSGVASEDDDAANRRLQVYQDALLSIEPRTLQEAVLQVAIAVGMSDGHLQDDKDLHQRLSPVFDAAIGVLEPLIGLKREEWSGDYFIRSNGLQENAQVTQPAEALQTTSKYIGDGVRLIPDGDAEFRALLLALAVALKRSSNMESGKEADRACELSNRLISGVASFVPKTIGGVLCQAVELAYSVTENDDVGSNGRATARSILEALKPHMAAGIPIEANVDSNSGLLRRHIALHQTIQAAFGNFGAGTADEEVDAVTGSLHEQQSALEAEILQSSDFHAITVVLADYAVNGKNPETKDLVRGLYERLVGTPKRVRIEPAIEEQVSPMLRRYIDVCRRKHEVYEAAATLPEEEWDGATEAMFDEIEALHKEILASDDALAREVVLSYYLVGDYGPNEEEHRQIIRNLDKLILPHLGPAAHSDDWKNLTKKATAIRGASGATAHADPAPKARVSPLLQRYIEHFCRADAMLAAVRAQHGEGKEGEAPFNAAVDVLDEVQHELEDEILASGDALAREAVYAMMHIEAAQERHSDHLYLRLDDLMGRHADGLTGNTDLSEIKRRAALIRLENQMSEDLRSAIHVAIELEAAEVALKKAVA